MLLGFFSPVLSFFVFLHKRFTLSAIGLPTLLRGCPSADSGTKSARMGVLKIIYLLCNWNNIYCCPISEREEFALHTTQPTAAKKTGKKGWTEHHKGIGCLSTVALVAWPERFWMQDFSPDRFSGVGKMHNKVLWSAVLGGVRADFS